MPSREGAPGGLDRASGFPFPLENSVRRVFPSTASNVPSVATFDDIPGLKCRPHPPHEAVLYATAVAAPRDLPGISANAGENGPRPVRRPTNPGMLAPKNGRAAPRNT